MDRAFSFVGLFYSCVFIHPLMYCLLYPCVSCAHFSDITMLSLSSPDQVMDVKHEPNKEHSLKGSL